MKVNDGKNPKEQVLENETEKLRAESAKNEKMRYVSRGLNWYDQDKGGDKRK